MMKIISKERMMVVADTVVKNLNEFLEGNYMAIHAYENFIHHIQEPELKKSLQDIQQEHKQHALLVAKRIQDLGGIPVDDVGLMGHMAEFMKNLTGPTIETNSILKDALVGEQRGIDKSKELVKGDLDSESLELVKTILNHDESHIDLLNKLLH